MAETQIHSCRFCGWTSEQPTVNGLPRYYAGRHECSMCLVVSPRRMLLRTIDRILAGMVSLKTDNTDLPHFRAFLDSLIASLRLVPLASLASRDRREHLTWLGQPDDVDIMEFDIRMMVMPDDQLPPDPHPDIKPYWMQQVRLTKPPTTA